MIFCLKCIYGMKTNSKQNYFKEITPKKSLKYSVSFIWYAYDTIDHEQGNQENPVPGLVTFKFFSFSGDRFLCLSLYK